MGRKPKISRDMLLSKAEQIVNTEGPQGLTIDALAKAAGISKGGVQYSFPSKDELVKAVLDRWNDQFDALIAEQDPKSPTELVRAYIAAMRSSASTTDAKMAGLMMVYLQNPESRLETRDWYQSMLDRIGHSPQTRSERLAFLAMEGTMLMRISGFDDTAQLDALLADIETLLDP